MAARSRRSVPPIAGGLALFLVASVAIVAAAWTHETDVWWVEHTSVVRDAISDVAVHWRYLRHAPPAEALLVMSDSLTELRRLVADNPRQLAQLERVASLVRQPRDEADTVRTLVQSMAREEAALQARRQERARASLDRIYLTTALALATALLVLIATWRRLAAQLREAMAGAQRLRRAEARTAALLDGGSDALWAVDESLSVTACNQRFRKLVHEVTELEAVAASGPALSFAAQPAWHEHYRRALAGERFTVELAQHVRGRQRHLLVSFAPLVVDDVVTGAATSAKDITTRARAEHKLARQAAALHEPAILDEASGAYNRRGFLELGATLLRDARSQGQTVVLLFADLEGPAGEPAVAAAAQALQKSVRKTDLVGRLRGNQLVVLATRLEDETLVIDRIQRHAAAAALRLSIGVVKEEDGEGAKSLEQLICGADAVLYEQQKPPRKTGHLRLVARNRAG